jgi:hypothetical protein
MISEGTVEFSCRIQLISYYEILRVLVSELDYK